jgi:hypothetical protein
MPVNDHVPGDDNKCLLFLRLAARREDPALHVQGDQGLEARGAGIALARLPLLDRVLADAQERGQRALSQAGAPAQQEDLAAEAVARGSV